MFWLRVSYRVGAVADGVVAMVMLAQALLGWQSPLQTGYAPEIPYRYAMALAGALMLGWTLLLLWADRRPVERRDVLMLTVVVVLGLMGATLLALWWRFMPAGSAVPLLVFQLALVVLFSASWAASRREKGPERVR